MSAAAAAARAPRTPTVLGALLLSTFVSGSAELLPVGLLPRLSDGLEVAEATVGLLVGVYALGLAVGGPLLTAATSHLDRRSTLVGALTVFAFLVASPAVLPHFAWFVVSRAAAGALQGLVIAAAFTTATAVVPQHRRGRAVSVVVAGFAVSTVVGLPAGSVLGELLGWRGAVLVVSAAAIGVASAVRAVVPPLQVVERVGVAEVRAALDPRVLAMLSVCIMMFAAPAAVMTYLVPLLRDVVDIPDGWARVVLVAYGVACVVGSFLGGAAADRDPAGALVRIESGVAVTFTALFVVRHDPVLAVLAIVTWGVVSSAASPSAQQRTVALAGRGGAVATSLPASAASIGIALGSAAGGAAYATAGPSGVVATGAVLAAIAAWSAVATRGLRPRPAASSSMPASPGRSPALSTR